MIVGQRDGAAMPPRHRAHQAEPEPIAGGAAARLQSDKAIEHALAIGLGDAGSAIGDLDQRAAAAPPHPDRDLAAPAVFERVVEQVGDRLRQQVAVALDNRPGRAVEPQREALLLGQRFVQLDRGADDLREIEPLAAPPARRRPPPRRC